MKFRTILKTSFKASLFLKFFLLSAAQAHGQDVSSVEELIRERAVQIEAREADQKALDNLCKNRATKAEKKACEEIKEDMKQAEKARKKDAEIRAKEMENILRAEITGCDPQTVDVHPEASKYSNWYGHTLVIRVVNDSAMSLDIETPYKRTGWVVRNLCPRGSITLSFRLEFSDSDSMRIPLKAVARPSDGGIAVEERYFYLSRYNSYQRVNNQVWDVHLYRVRQTK